MGMVAGISVTDEFSVVMAKDSWKKVLAQLKKPDIEVALVRETKKGPFVGMITVERMKKFAEAAGKTSTLLAKDLMETKLLDLRSDLPLSDMIEQIRKLKPDGVIISDAKGKQFGYFSPGDYKQAVQYLEQKQKAKKGGPAGPPPTISQALPAGMLPKGPAKPSAKPTSTASATPTTAQPSSPPATPTPAQPTAAPPKAPPAAKATPSPRPSSAPPPASAPAAEQPQVSSGMGMHHPAHKGAEVEVEIHDADPDRPIVAGQTPPTKTMKRSAISVTDEFGIVKEKDDWRAVAAELMKPENKVVLAKATKGPKIVGVITEQHFLQTCASGADPSKTTVKDNMLTKLLHIPATTPLKRMVEGIAAKKPDGVIIVDAKGKHVGFFSPEDFKQAKKMVEAAKKAKEEPQTVAQAIPVAPPPPPPLTPTDMILKQLQAEELAESQEETPSDTTSIGTGTDEEPRIDAEASIGAGTNDEPTFEEGPQPVVEVSSKDGVPAPPPVPGSAPEGPALIPEKKDAPSLIPEKGARIPPPLSPPAVPAEATPPVPPPEELATPTPPAPPPPPPAAPAETSPPTISAGENVLKIRQEDLCQYLVKELAQGQPSPVVWQQDGSSLMVHADTITVDCEDGFARFTLEVETDQTGRTLVGVTFYLSTADDLSDLMGTKEEAPEGDPIVVGRWGAIIQDVIWSNVLELILDRADDLGQEAIGIGAGEGCIWVRTLIEKQPRRLIVRGSPELLAGLTGAIPIVPGVTTPSAGGGP